MKSIYIKTYGCSLNQADSELMAGLLKKANYNIIADEKKADLIIINTCTVKGKSETRFYKELSRLKKLKNKKLIVSGCIPQAELELKKLEGLSLIGTSQLVNIVEVAEDTLNGNTVQLLGKERNQRLNLPKIRKNPVIEIIPICEGCLGKPCAYCKVKQARGDLFSYSERAIIEQIENALKDGVKEIWLTAQDTGCYGLDIKSSLVNLLNSVLKIKGDFKVRLGMANPNFVIKYLDDLIKIYKNEKMFRFLHIPVQSGNNRILKLMERKYTAEDYKKIVSKFRKEIPDITISTDIICGFPTETEDEFMDSLNLIMETKPGVLNRNMFWPRPGTKAAGMKQVLSRITRERTRKLTLEFKKLAFENNKKWLGWEGYVLIDEPGRDKTSKNFIARNYAYKQVILKGNYKLGQKIKVKIKETTVFDLRAVCI